MKNLLNIDYEKTTLQNGLEVIFYQNKSFPTVAVNIWYKVGSSNETPDKTGFAHLFEHMMFQGSEHVEKEMHFRYIEEAGGTLNGSTSIDRTNYYETLPADSLELALWLESDRMGFLIPALTQEKLENQKEVVMNERRQNYDNQPYGLAWEILFSNLFPKDHPYHWPTIGYLEHIENFNMDDVKKFFNKYYVPNNASLVIAGNFDMDEAKVLVHKYFDEIKKGENISAILVPDIELKETKHIKYKDNVQLTKTYFAYHSDKGFGDDDASLDILAEVLGGTKNSILYKHLVLDLKIAQDVSVFQYSAKYNGLFFIVVTLQPGTEEMTIREEVNKCINSLIENGAEEYDVQKAINSYKASFIYSLQNLGNMANQINNYNCNLGKPNSLAFDLGRYIELNKQSIQYVAKKYLTKNYICLDIVPKS